MKHRDQNYDICTTVKKQFKLGSGVKGGGRGVQGVVIVASQNTYYDGFPQKIKIKNNP